MKNLHCLVVLTFASCFLGVSSSVAQGFQELNETIHDEANARFAQVLAVEGNTAVVGCESCPNGSVAFIYELNSGDWSRVATITPSMPETGETFARSVDIREDVIAVGNAVDRIYVYEKPMGGWSDMTETAVLTTSSYTGFRNTGELVKITDKYILAYGDARNVFLFEKPGPSWVDADHNTVFLFGSAAGNFGNGFDALGDTVVIGEADFFDPAYLFVKPSGGWPSLVNETMITTSLGSQAFVQNRSARFVKITEDHIYIGMAGEPVLIYERPVGGWGSVSLAVESHQLTPQTGFSGNFAGTMDVANDSVVVVGDHTFGGGGAVEVFYKECTGGWSNKSSDQVLTAMNGAADDHFGHSIAINEDFGLLIGADRVDRNGLTDVGSFYYFENGDLADDNAYFGSITMTQNGELVRFDDHGTLELIATISESGFSPIGDLVEGDDKLLYGVSSAGGASGFGFVYRIYPDGRNFEVIHTFDGVTAGNTGVFPSGSLISINGKLVGGTNGDGNLSADPLSRGSIYSLNTDGTGFTTIYNLSSGETIQALHPASNGFLYAAIGFGPSEIFKIAMDGSGFVSIASSGSTTNFDGSLAEHNGKLYGMSVTGGANGDGYLFSIDLTTDAFTNEYDLLRATDGENSNNGVVISNGILYGSTLSGGLYNDGTIFSYDIGNDTFDKIYDYNNATTNLKSDFSVLMDGSIYGFAATGGTNGDGLLIQIEPADACGPAVVNELVSFESSLASAPIARPVDVINTAPEVTAPLGTVLKMEDDPTFDIDLSGVFGATDEPLSNLVLTIEENSSPSLFTALSISNAENVTTAQLDIDLSPDMFGTSKLVIKAADARGGSVTDTLTIEVGAIPDAPNVTNASTTYGQATTSGLIITPNAVDGGAITVFRITNIQGGDLQRADNSPLAAGDFISLLDGQAGLRWNPSAANDGSFDVEAAFSESSVTSSVTSASIAVGKATLTVTANDEVRAYGSANPTFSVTYAGFVNDDDESELTSGPSVSSSADTSTPVGQYDIVVSGATSNNYDFTYIDGSLTITSAPLVVTVNDQTITYGDVLPTFDGSITGVVNGDNITASYGSSADGLTQGTFDIIASIVDPNGRLANYAVTNTSGSLTVNPATLVITVNDQAIIYGEELPAYDGTLTGLVNGDNISVSFGSTADGSAGSFDINATLSDPDSRLVNYTVDSISGTLVVSPAVLTVLVNSDTITYGDLLPTYGGTLTGVIGGDDISPTYSSNADGTSAGSFEITATLSDPGNKLANYEVTNTPGKLTIDQASLTVEVLDRVITFGEAIPTFEGTLTGLVSGDDITASYSTTADGATAGSFEILATLLDPGDRLPNYLVTTNSGTLTINKGNQQIQFDALESVTYGAAPFGLSASSSSDLPLTYSSSNEAVAMVSEGNVTIVGAGSAEITAAQSGNNNFNGASSVTQILQVNKKALQATADNLTIRAGAEIPNLTISYVGFVNGDGPADLLSQPVATTEATASSPAGEYVIALNGGTSDNYEITLVNGLLTVDQVLGLGNDEVISVYPNPSSDEISISAPQIGLVTILDLEGKLVKQSARTTLDISDLPEGAYVLTVWDLKGNAIKKTRLIKH